MKKAIDTIFIFFLNCSYLFNTRISTKQKLKIFFKYIGLLLKSIFVKITTISFNGYTISGTDVVILFGENFVRNEYKFDTDKKDPLIIDCGANIGDSLIYFKYMYPNAKVKCFEPDKKTFLVLQNNVKRNNIENVELYNIALSDKEGYIDFFSDETNPLIMSLYENRGIHAQKQTVQADTLDKYIQEEEIDLLKIDVEGAEDSILSHLDQKGLLHKIKNIIVEYHHNFPGKHKGLGEFICLLEKNGFSYQLTGLHFPLDGKSLFQDILIHAYKI